MGTNGNPNGKIEGKYKQMADLKLQLEKALVYGGVKTPKVGIGEIQTEDDSKSDSPTKDRPISITSNAAAAVIINDTMGVNSSDADSSSPGSASSRSQDSTLEETLLNNANEAKHSDDGKLHSTGSDESESTPHTPHKGKHGSRIFVLKDSSNKGGNNKCKTKEYSFRKGKDSKSSYEGITAPPSIKRACTCNKITPPAKGRRKLGRSAKDAPITDGGDEVSL